MSCEWTKNLMPHTQRELISLLREAQRKRHLTDGESLILLKCQQEIKQRRKAQNHPSKKNAGKQFRRGYV